MMRLTISGYSKDPARAETKQYTLNKCLFCLGNFYLSLRKTFGHATKELKNPELEK